MTMPNDYLPGVPDVTADGHVVPTLPPIIDAEAFLAQEIVKPPLLIDGLLHMGSKLAVGGSSKGKKSWTLMDAGVSVATGAPWWGRKTDQGTVLYVNFEIQEWAFRERLERVLASRKLTFQQGDFLIWNLRGFAADAEEIVPRMIDETKDRKLALIIIDPIYKCLGGRDENKAGDIALVLNEVEKLAVQTGAAVAFGAHFSKGNQSSKESIDRIGGSGVFARDPDSILTMTAHEEPDAFTVDAVLRNLPPINPFCVRWEYPLMKLAPELSPEQLKKPGSQSKKVKPEEVEVLELFPKTWTKNNPRAALLSNAELSLRFKEQGFDKDSLVACRDALEKHGWIKVVRGLPHNQILAGLPEAVEAYEQKAKTA